MSVTNNQPANEAQLDAMFSAAEKPMKSSKQDTLLAVGEIAVICQEALLHAFARSYIEQRIKDRNKEIEAFNAALDKKHADYSRERRLPIKVPDASAMSTEAYNKALLRGVIRLVGEHDTVAEQSHVSRHETAVCFVFRKLAGSRMYAAQDAVNIIKAEGGMDRAIQSERGNVQVPAKLTAAVDKAIREGIPTRLQKADPISSVECSEGVDGPVVIIARRTGKRMEIIAESPVQDDKAATRLRPMAAALFPPKDLRCELIKRVTDLAPLVPQGSPTLRYVGDNHGGARRKVERVLVLRHHGADGAMLMISALPTAASPIVRVMPKAVAALARPMEDLVLDKDDLEPLTGRYGGRDVYRFEALVEDASTWTTTTTSGLEAKADDYGLVLEWLPVNPECPPLEVDGFSDDAGASLTASQLITLRDDCLKAKGDGDDIMNLVATPAQLEFYGNTAKAWACPTMKQAKPLRSHFRLLDVTDVVDALIAARTAEIRVTADAVGPLQFAWQDELASYEVYVPQVMDGGSLDPRKMRAMRQQP